MYLGIGLVFKLFRGCLQLGLFDGRVKRETHLLNLVMDNLERGRPNYRYKLVTRLCEQGHSHPSLQILPDYIHEVDWTSPNNEGATISDLTVLIYSCKDLWYLSSAADDTIHNQFSELPEPSWLRFIFAEVATIIDHFEEVWQDLERK